MDSSVAMLAGQGLLDEAGLQRLGQAMEAGASLDEAMLKATGLPEADSLRRLANAFGLEMADLDATPPDRPLLSRWPIRLMVEHNLLPLSQNDRLLRVATSRIFDQRGLEQLRLVSGLDIQPVLAPSSEIARWLKQTLGVGADTVQSLVSDAAASGDSAIQVISQEEEGQADLSQAAEDASIIRFVNQVLTEAIELRATDVHFEPFEDRFRVRYRVDGMLVEATTPPEVRQFQAAIVSRIKIISHLDIAEKRLPQDGRIKLRVAGREVDVRVSIIPMLHGEAVVLRLLDRSAPLLGLEHLGMAADHLAIFQRVLELPHGIILVTGPTGSGKTTTLYAGLSRINQVDAKIITIEDPIEYHLDGINQIQVAGKAGLTFASGLRAILRHDPDVVLIGEIRDHETAEIAVQASLTGHLVFSTLHTNDAPGALNRLVDMGIEPYLVTSSLELVLAQRLVRLICPSCRQERAATDSERRELQREFGDTAPTTVFGGAGCRQCRGSGYRGRRGIFELMPISDEIRQLVVANAPATEIRKIALKQGVKSLRDDGKRLVLSGLTTLEEILRMTKNESPPPG